MKIKPIPYTYCHACGGRYTSMIDGQEWPKICPEGQDGGKGCGNIQYAGPNAIGVMLQTVTDGTRTGILTPIRGHAPMIGSPGITGGFQELRDRSMEDAGARETHEEVSLARVDRRQIDMLITRATGPFIKDRRQILGFSVNLNPVHVSEYDGFVPDKETLAIDFSWAPRVLAFPSHTYALALYFEKYQNVTPPAHYLHQPETGDFLHGFEIFDIPYEQPRLDEGVWNVRMTDGGTHVGVVPDGDGWRRAD